MTTHIAKVFFAVLLAATAALAAPFAYVVNNGSNFISVVDLATRQVVGQISVGSQPSEMLILPDNRYALLTEYGDNTVRKIDLRTRGSVTTVNVGTGPGSITARADGRIAWVANLVSNDVSVIDVASMTELARIPVGISPVQVNQNPNGRFVYALNADSNDVSVIDTSSHRVISVVGVGSVPNQFAVHPQGQRAFVVNSGSNSISVFDLNSNTVTRTISTRGTGPRIVQFSPSGNRIFVLNRSGSIDIIDNASLTISTSVTVGPEPTDIAITSDGLYAYVTSHTTGQIWVLDMTSPAGRITAGADISLGGNTRPFSLQFDSDENYLFIVLLGSNELAVVDTNTDRVVARPTVGIAPTAIVQLLQPFAFPGGLVNAASFAPNFPVAGGALVSIFGEGLVAEEGQATSLPLPTSINGTSVRFNGIPAPLLFTSGTQINAVMPAALLGQTSARMDIVGPNGSDGQIVTLRGVSPGIFSLDATGTGAGAILKSDFNIVRGSNPARAGETVLIYVTGLGQTNPPIVDGQAAAGAASTLIQVTASIGGQNARVTYAGAAPGFAGLYQVNAEIPAGAGAGDRPVSVTVNGITSNTVTVALQ